MTDLLEVRRDGVVVARLRRRGTGVDCTYTEATLDTTPGGTPLLSCALPVQSRASDATGWCCGLLPEGQHLASLAARADVTASDTFALLARYGRDIAGAYEIVAGDPTPRTPGLEAYTEESLAQEVTGLFDTPLAVHDDSELSIAGLQDKLVLVSTADGWARPVHGHPSSHIMKLDHRSISGLIDAEAACLGLARRIGLTDIDAHLDTVGGQRVLILSRFDRRVEADGTVVRLHQEDLLQAVNIAPGASGGRAKYQQPGSPGPPSWWHLADLLDTYSADAMHARDQLERAVVFTTIIGNADCHAKNLAVVHHDDGTVELAPLYDTVPTALWPQLRATAALSVADIVTMRDISLEAVMTEARRWRHPSDRARLVAQSCAEELLAVAGELTHAGVAKLVTANARRLLSAGG